MNQNSVAPVSEWKPRPQWLGIDGCRAGWFYAGIDADADFSFGALPRLAEIVPLLENAEQVLVDMPIGLPSEQTPLRVCEGLARKVLGKRRSSVFPVPARSVLTMPSYEAANAENRRVLGTGLSRQSWNIVPKIREADDFLRGSGDEKIHEMHPEVAFWALNGKTPMRHNKRKQAGLDERLAVLERHYSKAAECFDCARRAFLKRDVASDDIVDAMVGAVTAMQHPELESFPAKPPCDDEGLEMKMVYAEV
jgi:predicted RNase H-like nuclease